SGAAAPASGTAAAAMAPLRTVRRPTTWLLLTMGIFSCPCGGRSDRQDLLAPDLSCRAAPGDRGISEAVKDAHPAGLAERLPVDRAQREEGARRVVAAAPALRQERGEGRALGDEAEGG